MLGTLSASMRDRLYDTRRVRKGEIYILKVDGIEDGRQYDQL